MINMPDYKEILKNGWHPERDGTSLKGQFVSLPADTLSSKSGVPGILANIPCSRKESSAAASPPPDERLPALFLL